jgi:hypothetical protein
MTALTLQLPFHLKLTDEEFEQIVAVNKELRLDTTISIQNLKSKIQNSMSLSLRVILVKKFIPVGR